MKSTTTLKFVGSLLVAIASMGPLAYAAETEVVSDADAQRAAIKESRFLQTQRLDAMAKECEHKFAVTSCQDRVRKERFDIEGKLNRQEAALNEAQRIERALEQQERSRERAAAQAKKLANLAQATPTTVKQPKQAPQATAPARTSASIAAKETAISAQDRAANANNYNQKQVDAIAKRAEVAKRLKDAGAKKATLPKPE